MTRLTRAFAMLCVLALLVAVAAPAIAQQPATMAPPAGQGPRSPGGGMMGGMGMMGGSTDPKLTGRMLQMRGEMMRAMAEVLIKYGKILEAQPPK